jgi:hypothetical protein
MKAKKDAPTLGHLITHIYIYTILGAKSQAFWRLNRHVEIRLPVKGFEKYPGCHPERSEGSLRLASQILRCAQDDSPYLHMSGGRILITMRSSQLH